LDVEQLLFLEILIKEQVHWNPLSEFPLMVTMIELLKSLASLTSSGSLKFMLWAREMTYYEVWKEAREFR